MKALLRPSMLLAALLAAGIPALSPAAAPDKTTANSATDKRIAQILKTLASVHRYGGLAISPDGSRLVWTSETKKGGIQMNVADTDGTHIHTVALGKTAKGCQAGDVNWAPDGKRFAFLSNCSGGKQDAEQNQIYMVTASAAKFTAHPLTRLKGFVHDLSWAPNGRELGILYVAGDTHGVAATAATKALVGVIGVTGVEHQQMAEVDAANGKTKLVTPQDLFVYEYSWAPDSARIAYVAAPPPGDNNWWIAQLYAQATQTNSKPDVVLDPNTVSGSLHGLQIAWPRWSPDGSHIALIGGLMSDQGSTGGDIYVVPSAGGTPVDVTPGIHSSPNWLTWTADDRLLVTADASGVTRISAFTLHGDQAANETTLLTLDAGIRGLELATTGHGDFAFMHSTFTEAPEIYTGRFSTDANHQPTGVTTAPHAITHLNAGLKPLWGKGVSVEWTNDGSQVQGWLLLPVDYDQHKTYPMIVEVHGGPSSSVKPTFFAPDSYEALE
ncbi:MAG: S9 family peptidase, partial [Gammaproteobacteria bacterium]